ncbi:MAG: MerR family transcriptional regulator [Phenylobacterium sp.]|nr:MerR family transcriptional regulator [Phenylobacterium sp.]
MQMKSPSDAECIPLGEVMRRLDLTARAIRYYEELGLVRAGRDQLNRRRYDEDALSRLAAIAEFRRAGLSLDDIAAILSRQDAGGDRSAHIDYAVSRLSERLKVLEQERREAEAALSALLVHRKAAPWPLELRA